MENVMNNNSIELIKKKYSLERDKLKFKAFKLMEKGVQILDPARIDIRGNLTCGENVKIDINVIFEGDVILADGVSVGASCILNDCQIGKNTNIHPYSLVDNAIIGESCFVGPYGRVRPGSNIKDFVQIGNFVEIKNANIMSKCRINHLSFIGDADLAESVTIGAGTITCNHNGIRINKTNIGDNAYVGSGSNLIAPIKIGANSTIGAGSTINKNVPKGKLVIARSKQIVIDDWQRTKE
jgi:bifunctional UDP-N-acetylglucosamine pyrophosphorylase / glucosamine-1-phosphate N-acetyltransferase